MPIQFDNYQQSKVDRLRQHLETAASKGRPLFYEIQVDGLKAIPRTDNIEDFDSHEDYLNADSRELRVIIYGSEKSKRNEQYVFAVQARNTKEAVEMGLNGFGNSYTAKTISELQRKQNQGERLQWDYEKLQEEYEKAKANLQEAEQYAELVEKELEEYKAGVKKEEMKWGNILSFVGEGILKRNAHLLARIPGAEGLAGIIEDDNKRLQTNSEPVGETTVSAGSSASELSEEEQHFIDLFGQLQNVFTDDEMNQIMELLILFSKDKSQLQTVCELLLPKDNQTNNF